MDHEWTVQDGDVRIGPADVAMAGREGDHGLQAAAADRERGVAEVAEVDQGVEEEAEDQEAVGTA